MIPVHHTHPHYGRKILPRSPLVVVVLLLSAVVSIVAYTPPPLITSAPEAHAAPDSPDPSVMPLPQASAQRVFLPLVLSKPIQITRENYPVGYSTEGSFAALGGRLVIDIPKQAMPYNDCTLTVLSPDPQAAWLEAAVYIMCGVNAVQPPVYVTDLYQPITISLDYAQADLTYLDDSRLTVLSDPSYDWVPEIDGWKPVPITPALAETTTIWQISVDTAGKRVILKTNRTFIVPRVAPGYTITDLAPGPGSGVYAAASPIIYTVGASGNLVQVVDLDALPAANDLLKSFSRFAVNTANGEIYLALRGKLAGSPLKLYAISGSNLRELYTIPPDEELSSLAYRPADNVLYLSMSRIQERWFGCAIRNSWVRALQADSGEVLGSTSLGNGYIKSISDVVVNSAGTLLAVQPTTGCFEENYTGAHLMTATAATTLAPLTQSYPGFRGADHLASDSQGRTYIANSTANTISVVAGGDSQLLGFIPVNRPGPLAVAGNSLYVVTNGRLASLPLTLSANAYAAQIVEQTLSGTTEELRVAANVFASPPAHNVLFYNGARFFMAEEQERSFRGAETELTFPISVPQPHPTVYKPLSQQTARVDFNSNGSLAATATIGAPETPYLEWQYGSWDTGPDITIAQNRWASLVINGSLISQEGLFPEIAARGSLVQRIFIQFPQQGVFHFINKEEGQPDKVFTATVTPYGADTTVTDTINPTIGGVLWAGGAVLEIPAGALPARADGYQVSFGSAVNNLNIKDTITEHSPIYTFAFTPEVLQLNQDVVLHMPRSAIGAAPVLAFFDPLLQDAYPIPYAPDPTAANYVTLTLPSGQYPTATASDLHEVAAMQADASAKLAAQQEAVAAQPQATQPNWLRRGLNWLGGTGIWHAVGLPNDKLETNHFVILYNTNDSSPAYAGKLLDALEEAYQHFVAMGATMPAEPVYVKIAPWIARESAPGVTPGIGSLFHFYMFINNSLADEALQDTAVHEYMHVLQKTNATPDGRYMNPLWWEEATAIWAQYSLYPDHTTYYLDIQGEGERWLRRPYSEWNSMSTAEMYAAMSLAEYLTQNYGMNAVFNTFNQMRVDWGEIVGVQKAIESVTGQPFDQFYVEFAHDYWFKRFAPVDGWTFFEGQTESIDAILRVPINQPVNTVLNRGNIPQLSSGLLKIYAVDPLPISFTRDTGSTTGSIARIENTCTGNVFQFYDNTGNPIAGLKFEGVIPGMDDEIFFDKNLGNLTLSKPIYLLYMDHSYGYTADCSPNIRLEQPTNTSLSPASVPKNTTTTVTISGAGFGSQRGQVAVGFSTLPDARIVSWTPTSIRFTWDSGSLPGTATVYILTKKGARSNDQTITITN